jgi:hypothetical protein
VTTWEMMMAKRKSSKSKVAAAAATIAGVTGVQPGRIEPVRSVVAAGTAAMELEMMRESLDELKGVIVRMSTADQQARDFQSTVARTMNVFAKKLDEIASKVTTPHVINAVLKLKERKK